MYIFWSVCLSDNHQLNILAFKRSLYQIASDKNSNNQPSFPNMTLSLSPLLRLFMHSSIVISVSVYSFSAK